MPDFSRIISLAYMRILERPADAGGLASYNEAMNAGLTEAMMRESLLRSPEYAARHPSASAARTAAAAPRKATRKATKRR
ncbi:MAG TPA: hypothetical protein VF310_09935 [Vicinamibacteria bacterium]|jgi:hypothetical protein